MFCADDDDSSLKASIVRPNDVLDIEVSPVPLLTANAFLGIEEKVKSTPKSKNWDKKNTKGNSSNTTGNSSNTTGNSSNTTGNSSNTASPMKRGDPFLPSVFSDENPIADYTIKKNSRKKPSDCKCKGLGYNLSPSALLPEEMRQQWGVGMFGKQTLIKANPNAGTTVNIAMAITPVMKEGESKCGQASTNRNGTGCSSSKCVLRCKNCRKEPCLCGDLNIMHEGFRVPDNNDRRKQKSATKGGSFKSKDSKSPGSLVLGSTNSASVLKRIACYSSKENSNIISTSNFHRNTSDSSNGHGPGTATDSNCFKSGIPSSHISLGVSRCPNLTDNVPIKNYSSTSREDVSLTPRARHRHLSLPPRRLLANITPSPMLSSSSITGNASSFDSKKTLSRSAAQMLMMGSQSCACDSCRRRASLMSRMEALGFSTSHAQQMLSPFLFATSPRYQPVIMQSSLSTPGRYAPYTVPNYSYTRTNGGLYRSPERYRCSSPSYYDYNDLPTVRRQPFSSTPLSMVHEMNKLDSSYMDNESSLPSPPSSSCVDDITDLSIQDTVDFFVSMKSPFVNSSPSPVSDASSGVYSAVSPGERCPSPSYITGSTSCYCNTGTCTYSKPHYKREASYGEPSNHKFGNHDGSSQPISLLYSSLVSDLEDELQCAIENIPTG